jgi:general secretion pathway protein L
LAPYNKDVARTGGQTLVGVCNKSWLRDALQPLQAAGLLVQRIVPELSPSMASAPLLHMIQTNRSDQALLCTSNAVLALPLQNRSLNAFEELKQSELKLRAEPAMAEKLQSLFSREVQIQTSSQRYLQATRSGWDFAQGEWQQTQGVRIIRSFNDAWNTFFRAPHWTVARYGLFALLVIHLIGLNAWALRLNQQMQDQQTAMKQLLQKSFPKVQLVIDAPIQMQKALQLLRQTKGAASEGDLDVMLKAWSTQMPSAAALSSIQFKNNELKINGLSSQTLAQASGISWQTQGLAWKTEGSAGILKLAGQP